MQFAISSAHAVKPSSIQQWCHPGVPEVDLNSGDSGYNFLGHDSMMLVGLFGYPHGLFSNPHS